MSALTTALLTISECPECGYKFDHATGDGRTPGEGDISICIKCAAVGVFGPEMVVRKPNAADLEAMKSIQHEIDSFVGAVKLKNSRKRQ